MPLPGTRRKPARSSARAAAVQAQALDQVAAAGNSRMASSNADRSGMRERIAELERRTTALEQQVALLQEAVAKFKPLNLDKP